MSDTPFIHKEAFHVLCGKEIGRGMSRVTHECAILPSCVVKLESDSGRFQNIVEWETWERVKNTPHARWFAPCRWISPCGAVLVMERTRQPAPAEYAELMPVFLTDFKRTNYGMLGKGLVCHDYGTSLLFEHGMTKRMKKAKWWEA